MGDECPVSSETKCNSRSMRMWMKKGSIKDKIILEKKVHPDLISHWHFSISWKHIKAIELDQNEYPTMDGVWFREAILPEIEEERVNGLFQVDILNSRYVHDNCPG